MPWQSVRRWVFATLPDLPAGARVGVALSGGGDSMALLHLLRDAGVSVCAATVDHGLRPDSQSEANWVAQQCAGLNIPHDILSWTGWDGTGNLQDQARQARYRLLADWAQAHGLAAVALGHTIEDQAETVLMRLSRGAGVDGMAAMAGDFDRFGVRFLRPILHLRRAALRDLLRTHGARWVEDPSNDNPRFDRVRIRQAMGDLAGLGITVDRLAQVAGNMADARAALWFYVADFAGKYIREQAGDLIVNRPAFLAQPDETRRRILAAALQWVSSAPYPPRRDAIAGLAQVAADGGKTTLHGCVVVAGHDSLRITREPNAVTGLRTASDGLWDGRWRMTGPQQPGLHIAALGDAGLRQCADWRECGVPRMTLLVSPAVWECDTLLSAPLVGVGHWRAQIAADFNSFLLSR